MHNTLKKYLYIVWGILFLVLIGMAYALFYASTEPTHQSSPFTLNTGQQVLLTDSIGRCYMVHYQMAERLSVRNTNLVVGDHQLSFKVDTIGKTAYWVPMRANVWKNYFSGFLGSDKSTADTLLMWKEARQKWEGAVQSERMLLANNPDWRRLNEEQQLVHALLVKIIQNPNNVILLQGGELKNYPQLVETKQKGFQPLIMQGQTIPSKLNGWGYLLLGIGGLTVLLGLWFTSKLGVVLPIPLQVPESEPLVNIPDYGDEQELMQHNQKGIEQYLVQFYTRYGGFYKFLNDISVTPNEQEKEKVLQLLVEMALHAHALARVYYHTQSVDNLSSDMNTGLILYNKQVKDMAPETYQLFDEDPQQTKKAHRILVRLLKEVGVRKLDGVFLNDVYVPSEYFLN